MPASPSRPGDTIHTRLLLVVLVVVALVLVVVVAMLVGVLVRTARRDPPQPAPREVTEPGGVPLEDGAPATRELADPAVAAVAPGSAAAADTAGPRPVVAGDRRAVGAGDEVAAVLAAARDEASEIVTVARSRAESAVAQAAGAAAELDSARRSAAEVVEQVERRRGQVEEEVRQLRADVAGQRRELERREERFDDRDRRLVEELERAAALDAALDARDSQLADERAALEVAREDHRTELERVAGLTTDQARSELLVAVEAETRRSAALIARDIEAAARADADRNARRIITTAIQRLASGQTSESVVTTVALPADEMKGRIIGREGRNIRAFEQITGVNVIIDDTPDAVVLSCFDPVRREMARVALEALVADGRIHPHRIEETYAIAGREVEQLCRSAAEEALLEVGIGPAELHPELVSTLGHLRYRTSYGQNVLRHLVECAHLAGLMALELGLDPVLPRRCAFLHDLGKALTHQVEGSHALVGADLARRCGEHPDVVHAIEAHHNEVEPRTVEALLTQAADAISGGRPGARRESLEAYAKRLHRLEEIASAHPGVEKVFAMQAGREVKVMVLPEHVDDLGAQVLAREIAKEIEDELTYPGQIRVTVVRESRATEIAR